MLISVVGCGYLGATHAAGMAELGFDVVGVEVDPAKVAVLREGRVPFYEPELPALIERHVASGRLRFTSDLTEAADADVHFLCVGTPQRPNSLGADLTYVDSALEALAPLLTRPTVVVGKSTVPVGTAQRLAARLTELSPAGDQALLAWNPEFLREGYAVKDTLLPDRLVFGVTDERATAVLRTVYATALARDTPLVVTDLATAELVKVAANAFLATKISFINAMAEVCEEVGADVTQLADAIGHDSRIGRKFLNAGVGFGGGCLPKDIRAFQHRAAELGVDGVTSLLRDVDAVNQGRRQHVVDLALEMSLGADRPRIAVLGAAFKPDSDDVRDSPALWIAERLIDAGCDVTVHDPQALEPARARLQAASYTEDLDDALRDADVVLHLTEWPVYRRIDPVRARTLVRHPRLVDGRTVLDVPRWREAGWTVRSLGRP